MDDNDFISVGRPLPRIAEATPLEERFARIAWQAGGTEVVDLAPALASHRSFVRLRSDDELFRTLRASELGDSVVWNDGSELSADWIEELTLATLNNEEFRAAMDRLNFSLDGMAASLGIARRLVADYRKNKPIPRHIALATRFLLDQRKAG
jgi:hypothetical protein